MFHLNIIIIDGNYFSAVLFYEFISLPYTQSQIEKHFHFERENTPHIKEIIKNKSVSLVSAHYSFGYLKPDLPNVVNVAGLHLKSPASLPKVSSDLSLS